MLLRTVRPTEPAISVADLRENERIAHAEEEKVLRRAIGAAEAFIQQRIQRAIMRQTFQLTRSRLDTAIELAFPPLDGLVQITKATTTVGGVSTDLDVTSLPLSIASQLPFLTFPTIAEIGAGTLVVEYETGCEDPDDVPFDIQQALFMLAGHYYRNREAAFTDSRITTTDKAVPFGVEPLIRPYRIANVNYAYEDRL